MRKSFFIAVLVIVSLTVLPTSRHVEGARGVVVEERAARAVHATPPAPAWDDAARLAELAARRAKVGEYVGAKSLLLMFSAEPRVYTGDVDYEYRQENNFFYLTHLNQKGATLVLLPGAARTREILFLPRRSPRAEVWTGHMYSAEEAYRLSGVGEIWDAAEFESFVRALRARRLFRPKDASILMSVSSSPQAGAVATNDQTQGANARAGLTPQALLDDPLLSAMAQDDASLFLLLPGEGESREFRQEQEFASQWAKSDRGLTIRNAFPVFTRLRQVKSPAELALIQHAVDITTEAVERAVSLAPESRYEYEVGAEVAHTFLLRGAENAGSFPIVAAGANTTTLHYTRGEGQARTGDLLLLDVGAEYGHFCADISRTFPVSGHFSPEQATIYTAVLAAQDAGIKAARPGATIGEVHNAATESLRDSLLRLGLITERNSAQYFLWFMHGTSHWLGMNVHDVGLYERKLEPGMVLTVEPGIYVRADALDNLPKTPENAKLVAAVRPAFEKYKNIGVRIEDDVVITSDGNRVMSAALPRTIPEVESLMARLTR
ncbi:MAG: aminopeptidase P family protein [Pyrinomonadaceae bacterium]